jgi:glycosyltransferase involved in cell wall biosynthesis
MFEKKIDISVVVPLYNEEGNVLNLHRKILTACQKLEDKTFEIIFVDDGSSDKTAEECQECSPLVFIKFRKNFGQTAAFDAGFKEARGENIITMDGDLQNDPADIPKLLEKQAEGFDIVSGWRFDRKDSFSKKFFSRTADKLRKILLKDSIHDSGCSLKVYSAEALKTVDLFGEMHRFIPALLESDGYTVGEVKVSHYARTVGETKYNWKRSIKGFVDMVMIWFWRKYASRPIHFFGGTGMVFIFGGSVVLFWMLINKIIYDASLSDRIWPLMGVFLIMLGVQFFIFGFLADITIKNYYKMRGRMNYAIKSIERK